MEDMFTEQDIVQLEADGRTVEEARHQVETILRGNAEQVIVAAASDELGIVTVDQDDLLYYLERWTEYCQSEAADPLLFVPSSGAASRMFKSLFTFMNSEEPEPSDPEVKMFFDHIKEFAFFNLLNETCLRTSWKTVVKLISDKSYKTILRNLLTEVGLDYGEKPKGEILFHHSRGGYRTAAEEHLAEGALYARPLSGRVRLHFTVSPQHLELFKNKLEQSKLPFEDEYCVRYKLEYSVQKPSTDTLSLTPDGQLFRDSAGKVFFRPGGHGSLIENLNEIRADVIFIKNIDNVLPSYHKADTIVYRELLGGMLLTVRKQIYAYVERLDRSGKLSHQELMEINQFVKEYLSFTIPNADEISDDTLQERLRDRLDRPFRVAGMVRTTDHVGGGPYLVREPDESVSLQIIEQSEINMEKPEQRACFEAGTFFNPVDIVCSIKDYKGQPYDLHRFVNPKRAFVTTKSHNGKELLALEKPGLWNGGMHYWNTIFVEVPITTFAPVKVVTDLLKPEHKMPS